MDLDKESLAMPSPCHCRIATIDDLDSLVKLFDQYRQFYECAPDQVAARAWLDTNLKLGRSIIFVAETNAGIQGFTQLYPALCSVELVNYFILYDLYVCDRARRGGIVEVRPQQQQQAGGWPAGGLAVLHECCSTACEPIGKIHGT